MKEQFLTVFFRKPQPTESPVEVDPFDTTFAENILPGKAELKIIENEILNDDLDFDPRASQNSLPNTVSINITYSSGRKESLSLVDRVSEQELNTIKPVHRDLLGGSNTDLSNLGDTPLQPAEKVDDNYIEYCDPFDTSIVDIAKQPGQTELKFLEKELVGDLQCKQLSLSDDEFDPRANDAPTGSYRERALSRPDALSIAVKTVSFDLPHADLLGANDEHKVVKPLTPFYVRKNSVPTEEPVLELVEEDPFDTSFVSGVAPGKAELKLIENELFDPEIEKKISINDQDFDPRDEKKVKIHSIVETIKEISSNPKKVEVKKPEPIDLLGVENNLAAKVLTPAAEQQPTDFEDLSYIDPFDTSIASNILPGKTELKLLETEFINTANDALCDVDFNPRAVESEQRKVNDLLVDSSEIISAKPLTPIPGDAGNLNSPEVEDIDPFDTSFANNLQPGRAEIKLLEAELVSN